MIPNIVHMILDKEEFTKKNYLSIISVNKINHPEKIYFYCYTEPFGEFWDKIKDIIIVKIIDKSINLQKILIKNLLQKGGIYLNANLICNQSYEKYLKHSCVLSFSSKKRNGISQLMIFTDSNSEFLKLWNIIERFYGNIDDVFTQIIFNRIIDLKKVYITNYEKIFIKK